MAIGIASVSGAGLARLGAGIAGLGLAVALSGCGLPADNSAAGQQFNASFAKSTHDSCVPSAVQHGASADLAEKYCTCVVAQLAPLSIADKMALPTHTDKMQAAATTCNAQLSGGAAPAPSNAP